MDRHHQEDISLHRITSLALLDDYAMKLTFNDGTEQTVDLEPILSGPIFGPLREKVLFQEVVIDPDFGALVWPNGPTLTRWCSTIGRPAWRRIRARRAELLTG